jgi:hypothetical protein
VKIFILNTKILNIWLFYLFILKFDNLLIINKLTYRLGRAFLFVCLMSIGVKYSLFFPLVFVKHAQEFSSRVLSLYKNKFSKRAKSFFKQTIILKIKIKNFTSVALHFQCINGEVELPFITKGEESFSI